MPKSKNYIVGSKRSASQSNSEFSKSKFSLSDLDEKIIPKPLFSFLKLMVPQVQVFEKQSKKDALKTVWLRWEQMDSSLKQPYYIMADQENPNQVSIQRDSETEKQPAVKNQGQNVNHFDSFKFNSNRVSTSFSCEIIQPKKIHKQISQGSDFLNENVVQFQEIVPQQKIEQNQDSCEMRPLDIIQEQSILKPVQEAKIVQNAFVRLKRPACSFLHFMSAKKRESTYDNRLKSKFKKKDAVEEWNNLRNSSPEKKKYKQLFLQEKQRYKEEMKILLADPDFRQQFQKIQKIPRESKSREAKEKDKGGPKILQKQIDDNYLERKHNAPQDREQIFLEFKRGIKGIGHQMKLLNRNGIKYYENYYPPLPYSDSIYIFKLDEIAKTGRNCNIKIVFQKWNALSQDQKYKYENLMTLEKIKYDAQMYEYKRNGFYVCDQPGLRSKWVGWAQFFYMSLIKFTKGAYFIQNNKKFIQILWNSITMQHVSVFKESFPEYEFFEVPKKIQEKQVQLDIGSIISSSDNDQEFLGSENQIDTQSQQVVKNPDTSSASSYSEFF